MEVPTCEYPKEPTLIQPTAPTPTHTLYLSNLDDQKFLRFSIKYLYLFRKAIGVEGLKESLGRALVEFYPLAGRVREKEKEKLEVECNGEGALFVEGRVEMSVEEFLSGVERPNRSWRRLLFRVEGQGLGVVGVPPLVVQATHLSCGGMIICVGIAHCLSDGIGSAQFLRVWSGLAAEPNVEIAMSTFHCREMIRARLPPRPTVPHPVFTSPNTCYFSNFDIFQYLASQPLRPVSVTFTAIDVLHLKEQCVPSLKCTSFEALASHVWRNWIRCLPVPTNLQVRLLFSVNVRETMRPQLPVGFYGNGFVLACAETSANNLMNSNLGRTIELVQEAKKRVDEQYVRSMIDFLEDKRVAKPDLSASLVISPWCKLGLEDIDFGGEKPIHMGPIGSEIYCLFLPVVGDVNSFTVLLSVPEAVADELEHNLKDVSGGGGQVYHNGVVKVNGGGKDV